MNEMSADISMKQRKIVGVMTAWTQKVQGLTYALVVLVGCFAVISGEMTTGALVACSILSSRMLAPIAQITGVLGRLQQAKVAKSSLDELMKKPVDQPDRAHLIHRSVLLGDYQFHNKKTVLQTLKVLQDKQLLSVSEDAIKNGFLNVVKNTNTKLITLEDKFPIA